MTKKRLLFISSFFPNPLYPNIATYLKQSLSALREFYDIDAVVPVPWPYRFKQGTIPGECVINGVNVWYPTYYYTPLVFRQYYGSFFEKSISDAVTRLCKANRYDTVYSAWLYPDAWVAAKVAKKLKLPLYVMVLGTDVNRLQPDSFLTSRMLEVADYATRIVCVSVPLLQKLNGLGCDADKLVYLQNGIDHTIFYPRDKSSVRSELGIIPTDKVILYVGNLKKEKGLGALAGAFKGIITDKEREDFKLVVIGGGRYKATLVDLLRKYKVDNRAVLLGERSLQTIALYMNACDVMCLPSHMEGQPNVVMEALNCHAKVVSTLVGGIPDLDDGRGNMILVPPGTISELAEALVEMIDRDTPFAGGSTIKSWKDHALQLKDMFERP